MDSEQVYSRVHRIGEWRASRDRGSARGHRQIEVVPSVASDVELMHVRVSARVMDSE